MKKLFVVGLLIRLILVFVSQFHPDILNHVDWGNRLWLYGAKDFYEQIFWDVSWPNQPLGSICLFGFIAKLYQLIFSWLWWLNLKIGVFPSFIFPFLEAKLHTILLKLPFVLADLGIGGLIYKIVLEMTKKKKAAILAAGLFLFNPALIYNSAIWGQTDSLVNFLALLGIYQLLKKKYFLGIFAFCLSLYFKLSLIIWLPIIILIIIRNREFKKAILSLILTSCFLILISIPFVHHGNVFSWLWYLYTNRILPRQGNMLSGNAFNFWTLIYGIDFSLRESVVFLGTTAKTFGRLLTAFFALISTVFFVKKKRNDSTDFLWLMILFSFASFLFLTNMHERYLYPIFAPLAILTAAGKINFKYYLILSLIHLLNLYNLWWYPKIGFLKAFLKFNNFLMPRLFSLVLVFIFSSLLVSYNKANEKK